MNHMTMNVLGAVALLVTAVSNRVLFERNLDRLGDRDRLLWLEGFSWWRLGATAIPVAILLVGVLVAFLWPTRLGWVIVLSCTALMVFALIWQYVLIRVFAAKRMERGFVSRCFWMSVINQVGWMLGLVLLAFGLAGTRL